MITSNCLQCNKLITSKKDKKCCNKYCYNLWYNGRPSPTEIPCKTCGQPTKSNFGRKYCSIECRQLHSQGELPEPKDLTGNCKTCGKSIVGTTKRKNYCSAYCYKRRDKLPQKFTGDIPREYDNLIEFYERMERQKFYASMENIFVEMITISDRYVAMTSDTLPTLLQLKDMWYNIERAYKHIKNGYTFKDKMPGELIKSFRCIDCGNESDNYQGRRSKLCKGCRSKYN